MFLFKQVKNPIDLALKFAKKASSHNDVPIGAVIAYKNNKNNDWTIVSACENRVQIDKNPLAHAEILAINKASKRMNTKFLDKCSIFVTLEPCSMCATAISLARMKEVIFLCSDEKGGGILYNSRIYDTDKHLWKPNIIDLSNEYGSISSQLLKDFFQKIRENKKK